MTEKTIITILQGIPMKKINSFSIIKNVTIVPVIMIKPMQKSILDCIAFRVIFSLILFKIMHPIQVSAVLF